MNPRTDVCAIGQLLRNFLAAFKRLSRSGLNGCKKQLYLRRRLGAFSAIFRCFSARNDKSAPQVFVWNCIIARPACFLSHQHHFRLVGSLCPPSLNHRRTSAWTRGRTSPGIFYFLTFCCAMRTFKSPVSQLQMMGVDPIRKNRDGHPKRFERILGQYIQNI